MSRNYDDLHLNKGAEDYEKPFSRSFKDIKKFDTTINDPKDIAQEIDHRGYQNLAGKSFNPLIQSDPGELLDLKEQAI